MALNRERLQGDALVGAANQSVGAEADDNRRLRRNAAVIAGKITGAQRPPVRQTAQTISPPVVAPTSMPSLEIDWSDQIATVKLTRAEIKASKPYHRRDTVDGAFDDMALLTSNMNWIAPL